jgi:hypothetical protein
MKGSSTQAVSLSEAATLVRRIQLAALIAALLTYPTAATAEDFLTEAEWYTSDNDLGGLMITRVQCSYSSNGSAVDYIDVGGESITLEVTFPNDGNYLPIVRTAGLPGATSMLELNLSSGSFGRADQILEVKILGSGVG